MLTGRSSLLATVIAALSVGAALAAIGASPNRERPALAVATCAHPADMVHVPAGAVLLGEDGAEAAGRELQVDGFWIDSHEVTNRQFAAFVAATGYRTEAERTGGSAVFVASRNVTSLEDASQWWRYTPGASWRHPSGPGSDIGGKDDYPVIHVTYEDALAYAQWKGHALPSEAQWERAARGHQSQPKSQSAWAYTANGAPIANTWQGIFPLADGAKDGFHGLAPAACFQANEFGVYDAIGNVWEWTTGTRDGGERTRILKGGSFLCAFNYCSNFRAAAWQAQEHDLGASHIGFRTIAYRAPE
jgi:formylglycine-generating enzyme required for sulfatase activity